MNNSRAITIPPADPPAPPERSEVDELRDLLAERERQLAELDEALQKCNDAHERVSADAARADTEREYGNTR